MTTPPPARNQITGVILAGGRALRMFESGGDKGLLNLGGRPILARIAQTLAPQVGRIVLNANAEPTRFASLGLPVVPDTHGDYAGPLAGLLAGMRWSLANAPEATHIASVPADAPFLPADLVSRLAAALGPNSIAIASSSGGTHPVVGLWPVNLANELETALRSGTRKVFQWTERHATAVVPFDDVLLHGRRVDPFFNVNTPDDLARARALLSPPPVIGIAGWKNSGKTTLAVGLIAEFTRRGYRVASIKHTHHAVTHDTPDTDSARHRSAGAIATALVGPRGYNIDGIATTGPEPALADVIAGLPAADLVLVEGYKHAPIPKIEVRSPTANDQTPLAPSDPLVLAIASDDPVPDAMIPVFRRDDTTALSDLILAKLAPARKSP